MKKVLGTLTKVEQVIMVATFVIMVVSSFAQVVNRNIFKLPIAWFDEASTYCMIYMALIGTEIGLRDGRSCSSRTASRCGYADRARSGMLQSSRPVRRRHTV